MYIRPAAAERKAWSRFIFTYEVGPKEPLSANSTPHFENAAFTSTPIIRTPLHLRLTFWLSLNVAVVTGTDLSQPRRPSWQSRSHKGLKGRHQLSGRLLVSLAQQRHPPYKSHRPVWKLNASSGLRGREEVGELKDVGCGGNIGISPHHRSNAASSLDWPLNLTHRRLCCALECQS